MRIAVLGANGTVGGLVYKALSQKYNVTGITRKVVDLSSKLEVQKYFEHHAFDVVINAAINSNNKMDVDISVAQDNFKTFTNIYSVRHMFGKVIHFGSGAEFDRSKPIVNASEEELFRQLPQDPYGMSKSVTSRIAYVTENWYILRLFGVFYPTEPPKRLLPKILSNSPVVLEDKYFDYLYLEDILPIVESYVNEIPTFKDINLVYTKKVLLSDFVKQFCKLHQISDKNIVYGSLSELSYTGDGSKWESLNLPVIGMDAGLSKYRK